MAKEKNPINVKRGRSSKQKGARGERELAAKFNELFGDAAYRGRQFHGGTDSPDIVTQIPGVHVECKRTEALSIYTAMQQSIEDSKHKDGTSDIPVVCHKRNNKDWLFIARLEDMPKLVETLNNFIQEKKENGCNPSTGDYCTRGCIGP